MRLNFPPRLRTLACSLDAGSRLQLATRSTMLAVVFVALAGTVLGDGKQGERKADSKGPDDQPFVMKKEFQVAPGGLLTVETDRGAIEITTADRDAVSVEVTRTIDGKYLADADEILKLHEIQFVPDGPNLVVRGRAKAIDSDSINVQGIGFDVSDDVQRAMKQALNRRLRHMKFRIAIPAKYNVNVKTGGGGISIADLSGKVVCETSGGSLQLGRIDGEVRAKTSGGCVSLAACTQSAELRTSGGSITAGDIHGDVVAHTSGGSIKLGNIDGMVSAKTAGGSIRLTNARGTVEATTAGGSVTATISKQPLEDCLFKTSGGNVSIRLARTLDLDIEAHGQNGRVSGPFIERNKSKAKSRVHRVTLNRGGPKLTASTSSGNIRFDFINETTEDTRKLLSKKTSKQRRDTSSHKERYLE